MDKPIAFFDSGVGGLKYLEAAKCILPAEHFVYRLVPMGSLA
jgi:glutamate racemase